MINKKSMLKKGIMAFDAAFFVIVAKSLPYISENNLLILFLTLIFITMLYIADFYSLKHSRFFKFAATFIALLAVFDAANIIVQYFFLYELVYGRKILFFMNLILFLYFTYRWVLINRLAASSVINIFVLSSHGSDSLCRKIAEAMELKGMGRFNVRTCFFNGKIVDESGGAVEPSVHTVIIDNFNSYSEEVLNTILKAKINGGRILTYEDFCEMYLEKIPVENISDEWLILSKGFDNIFNSFYVRAKRIFDIGVSFIGLVLASPLLLIGAVMIKLDSKGAVIFSQTRSTLHGGTFTIYKLRTMRTDAEKDGAKWASKNDSRITKVGSFLRKTRIDEIPQLYNVFKGDMSFIGPRPERPEFDKSLEEQIPYYMLRYLVKPGITGWAQVNHGYGASIEDSKEKLMYDLYYIKNYSFLMDFRIILRTVHIVLFGKGR